MSALELTNFAVGPLPSLDADLIAVRVAPVVSKLVVPGPAELRAGGVVIMRVALHPHPVRYSRRPAARVPLVVQRVPVGARQDDARIGRLLDDAVVGWKRNELD